MKTNLLYLAFNLASLVCIGGAGHSLLSGETHIFHYWILTMLSIFVTRLSIESAELREQLERRPSQRALRGLKGENSSVSCGLSHQEAQELRRCDPTPR